MFDRRTVSRCTECNARDIFGDLDLEDGVCRECRTPVEIANPEALKSFQDKYAAEREEYARQHAHDAWWQN